jgi:hypothetical protein
MNEYQPIQVGKSGKKVHAGKISGYVQKGHYSAPRPVYAELCTVVNTHYINRPVGVALLPAGTEITCEKCLRFMAEEAVAA